MTRASFIQAVSILIVLITTVFAVIVVIQELLKPTDIFMKISVGNCSEVITPAVVPKDAGDVELKDEACVLIPSEWSKENGFTEKAFKFGNLDDLDYLYHGGKGVLLKKRGESFEKSAAFLYECIKKGNCDDSPKRDVTVTIVLRDNFGKIALSTTYNELPVLNCAKNFIKLRKEVLELKGLKAENLVLTAMFHSVYAYVESRDIGLVNSFLKRGLDGLQLRSRGAKIRLLPWEYSDNPVKVLDRKGRQYGLDKEEYKKDEASIYHYRTEQYHELNGSFVPWNGYHSFKKIDSTDNFAVLNISKHLKNIQKNDGSFDSVIKTTDGSGSKKANIFTLTEVASALFDASVVLNDPSLEKSALKTVEYLLKKDSLSDLSKAALFILLKSLNEKCTLENCADAMAELSGKFNDVSMLKELITLKPVYFGVFAGAFDKASVDAGKDEKLIELTDIALKKYEGMKKSDKLRFIAYLGKAGKIKEAGFKEKVRKFLQTESSLIKRSLFDDRGFLDLSGGFQPDSSKHAPDTALSVLVAAGISKIVSADLNDNTITQIEGRVGNFLRHIIVTGDDFPSWGATSAKSKVQGGVRTSVENDSVKLIISARTLQYFTDRILNGRER